MSNRTNPNASQSFLRRLALPLAVSMSLQSFAWAQEPVEPAKAPASDEDIDQLDEIEVKGFRASLEKSLTIKREAVGQLDAIVAEDIGKFPDLNLAESLQRIPGVTITRDGGEGRNISVRGLGPQFVRVRINGIEAMSTTGGTDASGGVNRGRGFDFNVFASELFTNLTVHKTAAANIEEGSLGATVDLRTARPFDYGGRVAQVSAQGSFNDLSESTDPRGVLLLSDTFADGRFGALFSVAATQRNTVEEGASTVRWANGTSNGNFAASSPFAAARDATAFHPRLPRYGILNYDQERIGSTLALQWKASENTDLGFDWLYAKFDGSRDERFLQAQSFSRAGNGKPQTVVREGVVDSTGTLVYGVFDGVDLRAENRHDELVTRFNQYSIDLTHRFSDSVILNAKVGRADSRFRNPIQTTVTLDRANVNGYSYDYRANSRLPVFNYGVNVNDPATWGFLSTSTTSQTSEIRLRPQAADNKLDTARIDLDWYAGDVWSFQGGLTYKDYTFDSRELRRASETVVPSLGTATLASLVQSVSLQDLRPGSTPTTWVVPNIDAFANLFNFYCNCGSFALSTDAARGNNNSVGEESLSYFAAANFSTDWGRFPVRGNIGIRHVKTDQTSNGIGVVAGVPTNLTVNRDYSDTLPSFNLAMDLSDDVVMRFSAAKVMSRPGLGSLAPGVSITVSGSARTISGQNPFLDPFRAKTADLALEWYFAEEASLGMSLFYKDIDSFVQTTRQTGLFEQNPFGIPVSLRPTNTNAADSWEFTFPVNTPGGPLRGYELSLQTPFRGLPGLLSKTGIQLNYTHVSSEIDYLSATGALAARENLTGLSENASNATLYYEDERFGARVSVSSRGDFLTTVPGRDGNNVEGTKGTTNVDMSMFYRLNEQLEFTLEGINLTNEFNDQFIDSVGDRNVVYTQTGRTYIFGFRYKF